MMIISPSNGFSPARSAPEERPSPPHDAPVAVATRPPVSVPSAEQVKQAVQLINKTIQTLSRNLEFSIDHSSGKTIVRVTDMESGALIRQMPSQDALDIAKALDRWQGLLIRQKA